MKPTILGVIAATLATTAGVAVDLATDECRDVVWVAQIGGEWTKGQSRVCEGTESPVPEGAQIAWASKEATSRLTKSAKADLASAEVVGGCACGPLAQPKDTPCMATVTEMGGKQITRPAHAGEHLYPGTYSGGCVKKECVETSARKFVGEAQPVECGGVVPPAEKVVTDPAVEAGEVKAP
jgi:hypothetical protein